LVKHTVSPPIGDKKPGIFYGYIVVLVAFLIMVIMAGLLYSFGVFLKPVSSEFGWTRAMTSGAYSMGLFIAGLSFMATGRLNDRFGPRIVTTVCGCLLGLGYLLMSQVSAPWQLYLFWGVIVCMGTSGGFVPMTSTAARWFVKRRGMMTGIVTAGVGVGITIVPPLASWLILSQGWRTSFIIIGLTALVLITLFAQFLKRDPGKIGQLPYGANEITRENPTPESGGFSLREAARTKQLRMVWASYFFLGSCMHTGMVHIVPHTTDLGILAMTAANILAVIGVLSIVGRIGIGSISDKIGRKPSLIIGFALLATAALLVMAAKEVWMFYIFAILFGFSTGGVIALESPVTAEFFGLRAHGSIMGTIVFCATVGGAFGSLFAGRIFDITGSYYIAFLVSTVLATVGLILVSLLKHTRWEVSA